MQSMISRSDSFVPFSAPTLGWATGRAYGL